MKEAVVMGIVSAALIMETTVPGLSGQSGSSTERNIAKERASQIANKVKPGTVLTASLEKRDDQIIWQVRVGKSIIQVDPQTGES